jgi:tetratricopeptide (TPR) repeat protein
VVRIFDLSEDGEPEVIAASSSVRVIDSEGELVYQSDKFGVITSIDVGDLDGDGWAEIVFGSTDHQVRAVGTRLYSMEVSADSYFVLAERAYTVKDYNLTSYYSLKAEDLYDALDKEADVLKAKNLREKATGYAGGDKYYNLSRYHFDREEYDDCIEYAELALQEYRKLSDLRMLGEVNELKKRAELLPNAEVNFNKSKQYFSQGKYHNASDYALKARSAYSYLGNNTLEEAANDIYDKSNLYVEFYAHLDTAYNYTLIKDYGNATHYVSLAGEVYDKLNDTALKPRLENITDMADSIKRSENVLVYGGFSLVALIILLTVLGLVLFMMYFFQKGGFVSLSDLLVHYKLWFTEIFVWVRDSFKRRPRVERESKGLRDLRSGSGESIGEYFKR